METTLKLQILAQDILDNNYLSSDTCPITKALHRAGRTDLKDCGSIKHIPTREYVVIIESNETYSNLVEKVLSMYSTKENTSYTFNGEDTKQIPIEDFEHILIFEEPLQLQ